MKLYDVDCNNAEEGDWQQSWWWKKLTDNNDADIECSQSSSKKPNGDEKDWINNNEYNVGQRHHTMDEDSDNNDEYGDDHCGW